MDGKARIVVNNVSKLFTKSSVTALRSVAVILNKTGFQALGKEEVVVGLDDISFAVEEGERVGIIGHNGAGKTTLLNLIAGFSDPTTGTVQVSGAVHAIMSMGIAIREDLTGIENIYLEGELHCKSREETRAILGKVVEFADIGEFIDRPVKTYSSGMKARLAFGLLLFVNPEILIIDEVLGVGDHAFAAKSAALIRRLCNKGKILLVVSHSMATINEMTDRTIWLEEGRVVMDGPSGEVTSCYLKKIRSQEEERLRQEFRLRLAQSQFSSAVDICGLAFGAAGNPQGNVFDLYQDIRVICDIKSVPSIDEWDMVLSLRKMDGDRLLRSSARQDGASLPPLKPDTVCQIVAEFERFAFAEGVYEIVCEVLAGGEVMASRAGVIMIQNSREIALSKPDYYCTYTISSR